MVELTIILISICHQGGEKFLISVIAYDGNLHSRSEVYVKIINTTAITPGPPSNRPGRPPYYPTYLRPSAPLVPPVNPFPPQVPTVTNRPKQKTDGKTVTTVKKGLSQLLNSSKDENGRHQLKDVCHFKKKTVILIFVYVFRGKIKYNSSDYKYNC